jgi:hypothetical protein
MGGAAEEDEAVRKSGGAVERDFAMPAKPDRDGPRRLWHECCSIDPIEAA